MLAQTAESVTAALERLGAAAIEWKLDGARIQIHRHGGDVAVFTRTLDDITARVPEVVEAVRALPVTAAVFDGEAIALAPRRPAAAVPGDRRAHRRPPQRREPARPGAADAGRVRPAAPRRRRPARAAGLRAVHRTGRRGARSSWCRACPSPTPTPPRPSPARRSHNGHEGVMLKALDQPYEAGRRGAGWLKVKPVHTLDLVVLAAEWGHGRRHGVLSNLHLGARDPDGRLRHAGKDVQGDDRRDAGLADRAPARARVRAARVTSSTSAPSWSSRSPSTASRRARAIPAVSLCGSRGSSATGQTSAPPMPTPSPPCSPSTPPAAVPFWPRTRSRASSRP